MRVNPDWLVEMGKDLRERSTCLNTPECSHPENDPVCVVCMRGFNAFLEDDPRRTWERWFALKPWMREAWRREAGAE